MSAPGERLNLSAAERRRLGLAGDQEAAIERPHRRLTLSEVLTLMLSKSGGEHSSVALTRNAKGVTQIDVTVRTGDSGTITTALEAEAAAVEIYERLRARYPTPTGYVGAEGEPTDA